jgi:hypothetical protein
MILQIAQHPKKEIQQKPNVKNEGMLQATCGGSDPSEISRTSPAQ